MDLNTSEFSASLFFGEVCTKGSTSTPVHKDASKKITQVQKRKLAQRSNEPPTKRCLINDSDVDLVENNVTIENGDDDTIKCEITLIATDSKDTAKQKTFDGTSNETISNEASGQESSTYETISETYCSDALQFSNVSSIDNIPLDISDEIPSKFTEETDSVVFVSETFPDPEQRTTKGAKRMIIIDGSNVAFAHSAHMKEFSVEGIKICIDYFTDKGYDAKAVVPQMRFKRCQSTNQSLLEKLRDQGKVVVSPCKSFPNGKSLTSYDDRFIFDLALKFDGVIISNDNFRDLFNENDDYKRIIQNRVIGYMYCNEQIFIPKDPYGRNGPTADEILTKIK